MKSPLIIGVALLAVAGSGVAYLHSDQQVQYAPRWQAENDRGIKGAWEYYNMVRANIQTGEVDIQDFMRVRKAYTSFVSQQKKSLGLDWIEMGPDNIGGRIRSIVVDPNNPNTLWCGGVSGGLWRSDNGANTWQSVSALDQSLIVSTIALLGNGHIYVGTGSTFDGASGQGSSGFLGAGLFRSVDGGASFELVAGINSPWNPSDDWTVCDKLVADPTNPNRVWVAYGGGLKLYDEVANTFTPASGVPGGVCKALEVSTDGQTLITNFGNACYLSTNGGQSFSQISGNGFPTGIVTRYEFAISPDDPNYIYVLGAANGGMMFGAWSSTDRGVNWTRIWPQGYGTNGVPSLDIFGDNSQGRYDNVIAVRPGHPDEVWLGGVTLWKTSLNGQPEQIAAPFSFPGCLFCVHVDVHEITWSPDGSVYIGCDGGVFKSPNAGQIFYAANRDLNITQFYDIAQSPSGFVTGGTQDNGNLWFDFSGNTPTEATELEPPILGDGMSCDISQIDQTIIFSSVQSGNVYRSNNSGVNYSTFFDPRMLAFSNPNSTGIGIAPFHTTLRLSENWNNTNSLDSITWVNNSMDTLVFGETVNYVGKVPVIPQSYTVTQSQILPGDSLRLQDKVTSLFAVGFAGDAGVWVTRDALNFIDASEWWKVVPTLGGSTTLSLGWSADGDNLFIGTNDGRVIRVSGFDSVYSFDEGDAELGTNFQLVQTTIFSGGGGVTDIVPDPNDPDRLMITIGNYGGSGKVRLTTNASAPSVNWTNLWTSSSVAADLVGMPVYSGIIHVEDPNIMVVGTEMGMFATTDGGNSWTAEANGFPPVPVFSVRQQTWNWQNNPYGPDFVVNPNVIYAGTHGRGIFRTETLLGVTPPSTGSIKGNNDLLVYPNPVVNSTTLTFSLESRGEVVINVYDLNGRIVSTQPRRVLPAGEQRVQLDLTQVRNGTYIVEVLGNGTRRTGRMVVAH